MKTGVVGGVCMAHAPQFFTLPETEDKATVDRVRELAQENGRRLAALEPDVYIVIANDHANQFLLHCVPPFTLHRGAEARGSFAGRDFSYAVSSELSTKLIRHLQAEGFDPAFSSDAEIDYAFSIPLDFLGVGGPIIPLWVNAYVPPQPSVERCYAFGQAMERGLGALGVRAAVITSGGLSHFPGTERYAEPDTEFDRALLAEMETGNLRWLLSLDEKRLDDTGNVEVRCWAVTAGMLGQRKPDMSSFDPSWHHNYATLAWYTEPEAAEGSLHYPAVAPELVGLMRALHVLAHDAGARARYLDDPAAYAGALDIGPEERKALASLDQETMIALGVHPFLPFMARMWLDRQREQK